MEKTKPDKFRLERFIGVWSGFFVSANVMIGSGIFISPNGVFKAANGSVGISLLIWVAGGIVAALSSLCYGELASSITESGGSFTYFHFAFGPAVAFLYSWLHVLVPSGYAFQFRMFSSYAFSPFLPNNCLMSQQAANKLLALVLLLFILLINCWSVKLSVRLQSAFMIFKFTAMGLVVVGAIVELAKGSHTGIVNFNNAFDQKAISGITFTSMSSAFYQVMWSYDGWSVLTHMTEEVDAGKTILKSSLITLAIVTASYLLLNVAYLFVLTPEELMSSQLVASTFANKAFSNVSWISPLVICMCTAGALISTTASLSRINFSAARRGHLPQICSMIHVSFRTPAVALCFNAFFMIILIIIGDLTMLLEAYGFITWTVHGLSAVAVLVIRRQRPDIPRPYKVNTAVPILVALISAFFVLSEIIRNFHFLYLYTIAFFLLGLIVYHVTVKRNVSFWGVDKVTLMLQKIMLVAPTDWDKLE